jgi:hypothetical protein
MGSFAGWHSNTGDWAGGAYQFYLNFDYNRLRYDGNAKQIGYSIRLVKD